MENISLPGNHDFIWIKTTSIKSPSFHPPAILHWELIDPSLKNPSYGPKWKTNKNMLLGLGKIKIKYKIEEMLFLVLN